MPKISSPTVAEHRARQREALIQAAIAILVEEGAAAVTPAAVGARTGLARSSVYQYFPSSADLLQAVVENAFPPARDAVRSALAKATTPAERIDAYVAETLRLAAAGAHRPAAELAGASLPPACRARLVALHTEQARPLLAAVRDLGVKDPELVTELIGGVVQAAMARIEAGAPLRTVTRRALELLHRGLAPDSGRAG